MLNEVSLADLMAPTYSKERPLIYHVRTLEFQTANYPKLLSIQVNGIQVWGIHPHPHYSCTYDNHTYPGIIHYSCTYDPTYPSTMHCVCQHISLTFFCIIHVASYECGQHTFVPLLVGTTCYQHLFIILCDTQV